jgi:DOPA 4,5-dioxygenase
MRKHAHIYFDNDSRSRERARQVRQSLRVLPWVLYVGPLRDRKLGPHPQAQFEIHFLAEHESAALFDLERLRSGLSVLVHALTDDDLGDHTERARWLGIALRLDLTKLDPPGKNQALERFAARGIGL